jgi:hypothetical protein
LGLQAFLDCLDVADVAERSKKMSVLERFRSS